MKAKFLKLRCFESPFSINIDQNAIGRNFLAVGNTGSGKTTAVINPILRQSIAWRSSDAALKPGILIVDPKGDETVDKVLHYAKEAGREHDVVVLARDSFYPFWSGLTRLSQVREYAARVMHGCGEMHPWDTYWSETRVGLIEACLVLLLAGGEEITFATAAEFIRSFIHERSSPLVRDRLKFVARLIQDERLQASTRRRLEFALNEANNWQAMDPRTLELHRSTINNAIRPWLSPAAHHIFNPAWERRFDPADVLKGKILVASIREPQLSSLVFRALKRDFFDAVLARTAAGPDTRLALLFLDELALSVTVEDIVALGQLRAKGGGVIAAAHGISGIDDVVGKRRREALVNNFGSLCFFQSRENAVDELAFLALGMRKQRQPESEDGIPVADWNRQPIPEFMCPPGTLSRLQPHHCYCKLADGSAIGPVWLQPEFHNFVETPAVIEPDDLAEAAAKLRREDEQAPQASPALVLRDMRERGYLIETPPEVVSACWQLCVPREGRGPMTDFANGANKINGFASLPSCWLKGLLRYLHRQPALASQLVEVGVSQGILCVQLSNSATGQAPNAVNIAREINLWIYPSLWRPLRSSHRAWLLSERPDLRGQLESLSDVRFAI